MASRALPAELKGLVGKDLGLVPSPVALDRTFLDHWCEVFHDANPLYSDEEYARKSWYKSLICPPLGTYCLMFPFSWRPPQSEERPKKEATIAASKYILERLGLKGIVDLELGWEFGVPVRLGDRLIGRRGITEVQPEIRPSVGPGHLMRTEGTFWTDRGDLVCKMRVLGYYYKAAERPLARLLRGHLPGVYPDLSGYRLPRPAKKGDELPVFTKKHTYEDQVKACSATRDWFYFHWDREFTRRYLNIDDVYASMLYNPALVGKHITDWSGPEWRVKRFDCTVGALVHPGDVITIQAVVTREWEETGEQLKEIEVLFRTQDWVILTAKAILSKYY